MIPSNDCDVLVMKAEGCKLHAYPDPGTGADPWTIGFGATGPGIRAGVVWTPQQANDRLKSDLALFGERVSALIGNAPTTQGQFDALTSFAYNVGARNLASSTLLKLHKAGDYKAARNEFGKWTKAAGKVLPGLVTRRAAEAALYGKEQ